MTDGPVTPPPSGGMPGAPASLVDRVKNILTSPKTEWQRIDAEPSTVGSVYTSYVMILAAIPPIATAIGLLLFLPRSVTAYGMYIGISTTSIVVGAVVQYLLALASVYIMALIIDGLAPTFNSQKNFLKAFKVAAYYPTAAWVASILLVVPLLGLLVLLAALYSLYLLYLGLPTLMRTPQDKAVPYFVVTLIVAIVVFIVIGTIANRIIYGGMF
jgi:hypothetical protein